MKREIDQFTLHLESVYQLAAPNKSEDLLRAIFFDYIEYFKEEKRLRFWSNFDLIPSAELRLLCLEEYKNYVERLTSMIKIEFQKGSEHGELKDEMEQPYHLLYITVLQGILRGMLKYPSYLEQQEDYHKILWKMLWESIKK